MGKYKLHFWRRYVRIGGHRVSCSFSLTVSGVRRSPEEANLSPFLLLRPYYVALCCCHWYCQHVSRTLLFYSWPQPSGSKSGRRASRSETMSCVLIGCSMQVPMAMHKSVINSALTLSRECNNANRRSADERGGIR